MYNRTLRQLLPIILLSGLIGALLNVLIANLMSGQLLRDELLFCVAGLLVLLLVSYHYIFVRPSRENTEYYRVGIIGATESGKTTFITRLLQSVSEQEILLENDAYEIKLKGSHVIQQLGINQGYLDNGKIIPSTDERTKYPYTVHLFRKKRNLLLPSKNYRVEFGDFPGLATEVLFDKQNDLFNPNSAFFEYVRDADAFVFFIEIADYLKNKKGYTKTINNRIKTAWKHIVDYRGDTLKVKEVPILLLFSKTDLYKCRESSKPEEFEECLNKNRIGPIEVHHLKDSITGSKPYLRFEEEIIASFKELNDYFLNNKFNVKPLLTSSFLKEDNKFLGMEKVANHLFP